MALLQDCLDAMALVMRGLKAESAERAQPTLRKVLERARSRKETNWLKLRAVALYNLAQVYELLKLPEDARKSREEADSHLERIAGPGTVLDLEDALADKLVQLGKNSEAIPFCLEAIKLAGKVADRDMAIRLWRAGRCYSWAGFKEQAEAPLCKAIEIFRQEEGEILTPVVLFDLGNSLRRSKPHRAAECYQEAGKTWEGAGRMDGAASAWLSLGLLCADGGRFEEALGWYEKSLRVREADPTTAPAMLGLLYNNIANVYRQMGDFERAHQEIRRALGLLEPAVAPALASAYGSLGLIFRDQGAHDEALPWLQKARAEYEKKPNPDLAHLAEKLENEAAALRRLGRLTEAAAVEEKLTRIRQTKPRGELPELGSLKALPQGGGDGMVLIDLDGRSLAPGVYEECDLASLERRLEVAIRRDAVGELDGHESGPEATTIFLYGPDAEELFRVVEPILRDYPLCQRARIRIRQGSNERELLITP